MSLFNKRFKIIDWMHLRIRVLRKKLKLMSSIHKRKDTPTQHHTLLRPINDLTELNIATILDEFSFTFFDPETNLFQLTPQQWKKEIKKGKADILFVESAWLGKEGLWKGMITNLKQELKDLIAYCNQNNIVTVFWNKEDPVHFIDFINTAIYFDYIFTTDSACIEKYKKNVQHDNVFILPFGCQPKLHNPIEIYERKDAISFAGAYYKNFKKRSDVFKSFMKSLVRVKEIDIYDRHYNNPNAKFQYPDIYHPYIRGALPYDQIDKAYKGYKYAINLSTITDSSTMFARRIFELLASNTLILSNHSRGIETLFGDLILCSDNGEEIVEKLLNYSKDPLYEKKIKLLGLRKVLQAHTAKNRLDFIIKKISESYVEMPLPHVTVVSCVANKKELKNIVEMFQHQSYENKQLLLIYNETIDSNYKMYKNIKFLSETCNQSISEVLNPETTYISSMVVEDIYQKNYLLDLILATQYCVADAIGRKAHYILNEKNTMILKNETFSYTFVSEIDTRSSMIKKDIIASYSIVEWTKNASKSTFIAEKLFSIDTFNYCQNGSKYNISENNKTIISDLKNISVGVSDIL